jgi:predicted dehydrogenase
MQTDPVTRTTIIGCGKRARKIAAMMLQDPDGTEIPVICEPASGACESMAEVFRAAGRELPPNQPDLGQLLADYGAQLDAAVIVSPHALHHDQATACLEGGLDVLLEKPMVMNTQEALSLIGTYERTGKVLVVGFQGSLSPFVRTAADMIRTGQVGRITSISAAVWQGWMELAAGKWRSQPDLSGGGFMFDSGAHMLNIVVDLAGEDFEQVAAWLDNHGHPVQTAAVAIGRLKSGALVTLNGCGETIRGFESVIRVFGTEAILETSVHGKYLKIRRQGRSSKEWETVGTMETTLDVWEQFQAVRQGTIPNPSPPEVGLRMLRLWDAIKASAALGGMPVSTDKITEEKSGQ